jgi:hypothetical protein
VTRPADATGEPVSSFFSFARGTGERTQQKLPRRQNGKRCGDHSHPFGLSDRQGKIER